MAENCSVLDPWTYRPYACISEAAFARENDALTNALMLSDSSSSAPAPAPAIPSLESFSSLLLPPPGGQSLRRHPPTGRVAKKRKSRVSKRSPTTYITADPANFRELVQRVTGSRSGDAAAGHERPAAAVQGGRLLQTLDTSPLLLGPVVGGSSGPAVDGPVLAEFDPFFLVPSYPTLDSWGVL